MAEITIKTVKLSAIRLNPGNPRRISAVDMARLVKSLQEFPDMMSIREIVVDESMTVLGGNMRTLALRKIGVKEVTAKIVKGLTEAQKREFIVKDNASFGEWDMDLLSGWDNLPLIDWGIKIPGAWGSQGVEQQEVVPTGDKASGGSEGKFSPSLVKEPLIINLSATEKSEWDQAKEKAKLVDDKALLLKMARKFLKEGKND